MFVCKSTGRSAQVCAIRADGECMSTEDKGLDRLVARHDLPLALSIRWNTKPRRRLFRKDANVSSGGMVLDLSLTGALIEVVDPVAVEVGDYVEIRLGESSGIVEVKHMKAGERTGSVLFGVRFVDMSELQHQIELVVERVRGNSEQLREAWHQAN